MENILELIKTQLPAVNEDYSKELLETVRQSIAETPKRCKRGTSRKVYQLGNGLVVKMAYNQKGIEQNKVEYDLHDEPVDNYFNKCFWMSNDGKYLICEECTPLRGVKRIREYFRQQYEGKDGFDDFVTTMVDYYNLGRGDLLKTTSYGVNSKGDVVLIDYGLTYEVWEKYYKHT